MQQINENFKALFCLIRRSLWKTNEQLENSNLSWQEIFNEAKHQTVSAIAFDGTRDIESIDSDVFKKWQNYTALELINNENVLIEQEKLLKLLNKNNIQSIILKGASAAINYSKPELRAMGDIDFLIDLNEFEKANNILINNGYKLTNNTHRTHFVYQKNNCYFEMHKKANGIPENDTGEIINNILMDAVAKSKEAEFNGHRFSMLSNTQQALTLILHIQNHMQMGGLGLRQICDWAVFIANVDENEMDEVLGTLESCGLLTFTKVITKLCVLHLGLNQDGVKWSLDAEDELCDFLIKDFLLSGNFGRKNKEIYGAGNLITIKRNERSLLNNVFHNYIVRSKLEWQITKKYPFISYFAPFYYPTRYLFKIITGKKSLTHTVTSMRVSTSRRKVYDKLKIFEINK